MNFKKPKKFFYRIAQFVSSIASAFLFKRKILRNEIKGKKGPYMVIANHQSALDFVNLIGVTKTPMNFVISDSFYNTLPIKGYLDKIAVIPKQQFQTSINDMKKMKAVIENDGVLAVYPAGLMCEDGVSTPIPAATYKFLKWIKTDIYVAKTQGTYFTMPKWAKCKKRRRGRTYIDIYKLFSKEELETLEIEEIQKRTEEALLFDAYREQEELMVKYKYGDNVEGFENVLYMCPHCKSEFTIQLKDNNTLYCTECGYEQSTDKYGFMHNEKKIGAEIRYASDWSRLIYDDLKSKIQNGELESLSDKTKIHMIDYKKHKFVEVGEGTVTLTKENFKIVGKINGEEIDYVIPILSFASLPFKPGECFEIQHGSDIFRCVLDNANLVMKFINMVKIFYELNLPNIGHDHHYHNHEEHCPHCNKAVLKV